MLLVDLRTKTVISLHNINRLVFITETECVYCAVRTGCLSEMRLNPLNADLNPICHVLALLGAHHILHISRIRVNLRLKCCPLAQIIITPAQK